MNIGDNVRIHGEDLPPHLIQYGGYRGEITEIDGDFVRVDFPDGSSVKLPEKHVYRWESDDDWVSNYLNFLRETLIPDLRESGMNATADDFNLCVQIINQLRR